ncbi:hypothetical protein [Epilithonimonas sp.]|uniref:hypothetical protein n=1 Tax=Epilithonimonas sp. TaxID=2894511 RepID=UPI00289B55BA|nr:hypothetical protein [Epilithonimonas sp.]
MNRKLTQIIGLSILTLAPTAFVKAQKAEKTNDFKNPLLTHYLNDEHTRYISFSGYAELWARYTQLNPGSLVNSQPENSVSDLSLRRIRVKMQYQPTEKLLFVLQAGTTNVNVASKTATSLELLDAYGEYKFNDKIAFGIGRSTWKGLSRFTTGPLNTLLFDLPAYATSNTGVLDYTVREFNAYLKGQLGKFDYRLVVIDPYNNTSADPKYNVATFSKNSVNKEFTGYFRYQFLDKESIASPFNSGTYVGKKKVLALGAGFDYLKDALYHKDASSNVINDDMKNLAVDVFYDTPINKEKGTSFSAYAMAMHNDYGPNYVRYVGTNSPASGVDATKASLNGAGNAFPIIGTGNTYFIQAGGTLPYFNKSKSTLQLQPAASIQISNLDGLKENSVTYDAGISLLFNGMSSRLTFDAQNRPIYMPDANSSPVVTDRKWQFVLKYRIDFN